MRIAAWVIVAVAHRQGPCNAARCATARYRAPTLLLTRTLVAIPIPTGICNIKMQRNIATFMGAEGELRGKECTQKVHILSIHSNSHRDLLSDQHASACFWLPKSNLLMLVVMTTMQVSAFQDINKPCHGYPQQQNTGWHTIKAKPTVVW